MFLRSRLDPKQAMLVLSLLSSVIASLCSLKYGDAAGSSSHRGLNETLVDCLGHPFIVKKQTNLYLLCLSDVRSKRFGE